MKSISEIVHRLCNDLAIHGHDENAVSDITLEDKYFEQVLAESGTRDMKLIRDIREVNEFEIFTAYGPVRFYRRSKRYKFIFDKLEKVCHDVLGR